MRVRFEIAGRIISAIGIGVGVVVAQKANGWLVEQEVASPLLLVVAFGIVLLTSELLRFLFDYWILGWPVIRRLVLGPQYVEGTWFDEMRKGNDVLAQGITRIRADRQSIRISGYDCAPDDSFTGEYHTEILSVDWPRVRYLYHYARSDADRPEEPGFAELQFDERDGTPVHYYGGLFDPVDGAYVTFKGWKVSDRAVRRQLDEHGQGIRAVREFFQCRVATSD